MENGGDGTFNGVEWLLREPVEAPGHGLFFGAVGLTGRVRTSSGGGGSSGGSGEWCWAGLGWGWELLLLRATQARGSLLVLHGAGATAAVP